jgi:nicotinamide riboside kinase
VNNSEPWLISVLGGECTGKTELCEALVERLGAVSFEETLRVWVRRKGRPPLQEEQKALMEEQCAQELQAIERARARGCALVISDSGPLMTAIYSLVYFGDACLLEQAHAWQARYHLTLVCRDDLPWMPDPGQRDGEEFRARAQSVLKEALQSYSGQRVAEVYGQGEARAQLACELIQGLHFYPR